MRSNSDATTTCPRCLTADQQVRAGRHRSGSQRFECRACGRGFTPEPGTNGYSRELRERAVCLHLGGMNLRSVAHMLGVGRQSVANWTNGYFPCPPGRCTAALLLDANPALSLDELRAMVGRDPASPHP